jgi:hypothetical protein
MNQEQTSRNTLFAVLSKRLPTRSQMPENSVYPCAIPNNIQLRQWLSLEPCLKASPRLERFPLVLAMA